MKNHVQDDQEAVTEEVLNPVEGAAAAAETEAAPQTSELETVKAERDQLFDRLARLQAEFDNARKRAAKEGAEFRDYAVAGAVEQFLPVLDNFQLALAHGGTVEQLRSGVELIIKQMEDALRNLGVQPVETVGSQFDPRLHEAIEFVETSEHPDHQILDEVRRGYRIKERLLRPAMVRVANNPNTHDA
ncbi:MAG TPA: nucleotide exchange factor GrpE [Acidobacteriaceae bacterium]